MGIPQYEAAARKCKFVGQSGPPSLTAAAWVISQRTRNEGFAVADASSTSVGDFSAKIVEMQRAVAMENFDRDVELDKWLSQHLALLQQVTSAEQQSAVVFASLALHIGAAPQSE